MEQLPTELIELILASGRLTIQDVLNFSTTCSNYRNVVCNSNFVWKHKFMQKWPQFLPLFSKEFSEWFKETIFIYELSKRTHAMLSTMSERFYKKSELSNCDMGEWALLMDEMPRIYHYVAFDLMTIIHCDEPIRSFQVVPVDTPGNKTLQYYALKVLRLVRQHHLSKVWENFMSLPVRQQILEKGAVLIAQWFQPVHDIKCDFISKKFDDLAVQVIEELRSCKPNHPLHKVPAETIVKWSAENLDGNQWDVRECQEIIQCLTTVLYKNNKFRGNSSTYYVPENSFINEVLTRKQGIPITLAIVYESVGRRLGLKFDPINFPAHFLLRFTEGKREKPGNTYYIDVFNNGSIINRGVCPRSSFSNDGSQFDCATAKEVVERMANNLQVLYRQHTNRNGNVSTLRATLELCHLINPQDFATIVSLARVYMWHNIDTNWLEASLLRRGAGATEQEEHVLQMLRDYNVHLVQNNSEPILQVHTGCYMTACKGELGDGGDQDGRFFRVNRGSNLFRLGATLKGVVKFGFLLSFFFLSNHNS
uniref:Protein SirB1 N-terminal domain-containing protein n=1 Tax=Photinus pyralis TaxID=7054 RepID=A0A1Y1KNL3_PHOPY